MPQHRITVHPSKPLEVASADLVIEVTSGDGKLGELWVSRGSIDWRPKGHTYASRSLSWEQFADLMEAPGRLAPAPVDHTGKYRPLWAHLCGIRTKRASMTFSEVEQILGFPLPASSRNHEAHWYGYEGSAVARAIADAGWRASKVNLTNETVQFVRA